MTTPRLLGYWRLRRRYIISNFRYQMLQWPNVTWLVDPDWREDERRRVGDYLQRGTRVNQQGGLSECRFCERHNGSAELTDGVYCWPEGLAHYVSEHDVRLPEEFVGHALSQPPFPPGLPQPSFDKLGTAPPVMARAQLRAPPVGAGEAQPVRDRRDRQMGSELVAASHADATQRPTVLDTPRTGYVTQRAHSSADPRVGARHAVGRLLDLSQIIWRTNVARQSTEDRSSSFVVLRCSSGV